MRFKIALCFALLFGQWIAFAQETSRWSLGVEFSIDDLSLSTSGDERSYLVTEGNINGYAVDFDLLNYSLGGIVYYDVSRNFDLFSGLIYTNKDFTGIFNCATCVYFPSFE